MVVSNFSKKSSYASIFVDILKKTGINSEMKPYISVIIPSFNRAAVLERAIYSVLRQSYTDFELIVVDDGSTDHTKQLVKDIFKDFINVYYYHTDNLGVSAARNYGASQATGEWLAFLDSDDEWFTNKLENQVEVLRQNPAATLIHTEEVWHRNGHQVDVPLKYKKQKGDLFEKATQHCVIGPSTVMLRADIFNALGGFDESFKLCEDYELWLRWTAEHPIHLCEEPMIIKYDGADNQLSKQGQLDYWRIKALIKFIKTKETASKYKLLAKTELKKKYKVYALGCVKHNNATRLKEIDNLMSRMAVNV
ncbi:MAG: glycosyltransferase family 2 protein [Bdellovibrionales bacterium]|nr:glycosyltransferase family 2 protein [Bdellovibrionales bacterium]